jgi:hypothetical protein
VLLSTALAEMCAEILATSDMTCAVPDAIA